MEMFKDKEVKAIVAYRGGYGCIRMLPYLDIGVIKKILKFYVVIAI